MLAAGALVLVDEVEEAAGVEVLLEDESDEEDVLAAASFLVSLVVPLLERLSVL